MANRYWVGGTGTWNTTSTTNWSTTSGGASGASAPTSADDVFFNASSGGGNITVSAAVCRTFDSTGFTGSFIGTSTLTVYGSFILGSTISAYSVTGNTTVAATSGSFSITTNGKSLARSFIVNAPGGTYTLGSAFTTGSAYDFSVLAGTFNTGGYNITAGRLVSTGSLIRSISLSSSTITLTNTATAGFNYNTVDFAATNLTLNAGTSSIVCSASLGKLEFAGAGKTFYNVTLTATNPTTYLTYISGANTFNNLTINATFAAFRAMIVYVSADQIISGTWTVTGGADARYRTWIRANVNLGLSINMTCAAFSGTDADFYGINVLGAAAPISGTRLGDRGLNSGITFTSKTVYWNLAGTQIATSLGWATSSGGVPAANNFPLAQDTMVFDNTGSMGTVQFFNTTLAIGSIDSSARTAAGTLSLNAATNYIYGSINTGSGITYSSSAATNSLLYYQSSAVTIASAGKTFWNCIVTLYCVNGSVSQSDAAIFPAAPAASYYQLNIYAGTFNTNNYALTVSSVNTGFPVGATATRSFLTGASSVVFTGSYYTGLIYVTCDLRGTNVTVTQGAGGTFTFNSPSSFYGIYGAGRKGYPTIILGRTYGNPYFVVFDTGNGFYDIKSTANGVGTLSFGSGAVDTYFNSFNLSGSSTLNRFNVTVTSLPTRLYKRTPWHVGSGSTVSGVSNITALDGEANNYLSVTNVDGLVRSGDFISFFGA